MIEKVCVFIFKRTMRGYEFLVLKRTEKLNNIWQPVTGHIEKDEKPLEAAKREVLEETGIKEIIRIIDPEYFFEFESDARKKYKEYLFGFEVPRSIEEITISDEHKNYSWLNAETVKQMLHWANNKQSLDRLIEKGGL